jgi:UDP-galactose transporter
VFQNAGTNVIMPLARRTEWNSQTGVINQEITKGVVSALALLWGGGLSNLAEALRPTPEALKTAVPALLFLLQNNLQYIAAGYLSPTMFACLYQLKILSAALLSVLLLKKNISCRQWAALAILVVGAALVVLGHVKPKMGAQSGSESGLYRGAAAILAAPGLSGLAGVYFEKLLKGSNVTLAARNLQLAGYSSVIGFIVFFRSGGSLASFFHGYTAMVWISISNNALGGLIVAVIIKYADNIWKNNAATMGIVVTSFVQAVFLGDSLGPGALLGVALVITAVLLYSGVCSHGSPTPAAQPPLSPTSAAQPPGPSQETIGRFGQASSPQGPADLPYGRPVL